MAVRTDAAGDYLSRTASLPSDTAFTLMGWGRIVTDLGSGAFQPLYTALNAGATAGHGIYWEQGTTPGSMAIFSGGAAFTLFASRPAVGTDFCWYARCSGSGANQYEAGWRAVGSTTWVTASMTMTTGMSVVDWRIANAVSFYYSDALHENFKCWDRALSTTEIDVESYFFRPQYPTSLNFWWPLHNVNDVADRSGNGRSPTVGGTLATGQIGFQPWKPGARIYIPAAAASGAIAGSSALVFAAGSSTLTGSGALAGSAAITFAGTPTLRGTGALAGSAALLLTGQGALTGSGALAGSAANVFANSATLTGSGALAGSSANIFTPTATLVGSGALAGSAAMVFDGTLARSGDIAGTSALTFSSTAVLAGTGALSGSAALVFGGINTLTGSGALAGSSALLLDGSAVLTGTAAGDVVGSAALTITPTGVLTGAGALAGVAALTFGASAAPLLAQSGGAADDGWVFSRYRSFNKQKQKAPKPKRLEPDFAKVVGPNLLAQFEAPANPVIRPEIAEQVMAIARPKPEPKPEPQAARQPIEIKQDEEEALVLLLLQM